MYLVTVRLSRYMGLILGWVRVRQRLFPILVDLAAWMVGLTAGVWLKLTSQMFSLKAPILLIVVSSVAIHWSIGRTIRLYRQRWRISSFEEVAGLGLVWAATSMVLTGTNFALRPDVSPVPTSGLIVGTVVSFMLMFLARGTWRRLWELQMRPRPDRSKATIVFGAGEGGKQMIRAMLVDPNCQYLPVALLDDDPRRANRELHGVRVRGTRHDLAEVANKYNAEVLLVAIVSANSGLIQSMAEAAAELDLDVRVLPPSSELVGRMTLDDVRTPTVEDLLGRDPVTVDLKSVSAYVAGKRVLVTGAGGSIGSELSRQLSEFNPAELYLLDRDENGLHSVQLSIEGKALLDSEMLVVANIRDRDRVFEIFDQVRPEVVFHAAALKHLTLLERFPAEAIKTNTVGTANVLDAAQKFDVERFVNVSTDKAADPTSALGASKLAAERLTAHAAAETGKPYVSVRFGNVLGSSGSVLPTFLGQIEQGKPITVTDPDVTRYFMTIPEAVRLVVQAGAIGDPGELMILDMGEPVKIVDLAEQLIAALSPKTEIVYTGLRPGEKLHEALNAEHEIGVPKVHPRILHTHVEAKEAADAMAAVGPKHVDVARSLLNQQDPVEPDTEDPSLIEQNSATVRGLT